MGRDPVTVYTPSTRAPNVVSEDDLREALAVRERRRVRRDTTVSVAGRIYELSHGFLAGRVVDIVYSHLDEPLCPEVEHEGRRYAMHLVDPEKNADGRRRRRAPNDNTTTVSFDPSLTTRPTDDDVAGSATEDDDDAIF